MDTRFQGTTANDEEGQVSTTPTFVATKTPPRPPPSSFSNRGQDEIEIRQDFQNYDSINDGTSSSNNNTSSSTSSTPQLEIPLAHMKEDLKQQQVGGGEEDKEDGDDVDDRFAKLTHTATDSDSNKSSEYQYVTIDISNHNRNLLKTDWYHTQQHKQQQGEQNQSQLTGGVDIIGILNASNSSDQDNISMTSMTPSQIFDNTCTSNSSNTFSNYNTGSNNINNNFNSFSSYNHVKHFRPPKANHNTTIIRRQSLPKRRNNKNNTNSTTTATTTTISSNKIRKTGITYYDTNDNDSINSTNSTTNFPTIEVNILSHGSSTLSLDDNHDDHDSEEEETTTTTATRESNIQSPNNSRDTKTGSVISIVDKTTFHSKSLSPLTPYNKREKDNEQVLNTAATTAIGQGSTTTTLLHRRMSSSDRLLKMLDEMDKKKKPFDVDDYRDEDEDDEHVGIRGRRRGGGHDEDDYDDDENMFESPDMKLTGRLSSGSSFTSPTANIHYANGSISNYNSIGTSTGAGTRTGRVSRDGTNNYYSPSQSSTKSSSFKSKPYDCAALPQLPNSSSKKRCTSHGSHKSTNNDGATLHAQSFILAIAFFAVWSQQNLMAPNLTQMAEYFHFSPEQRDLYLGANIALATGVLSLPVSGVLGFLADVVSSRIKLFAGTVFVGGLAAISTGMSETYTHIYFSRFVSGGCMAGSVVIAFSILGDLFDAKDRNVASSGLTAMMGAGILLGQVFAGTIGDIFSWKVPFYVSGIFSIITSLMVLRFVNEPVRGGKEKVLQEMLASGTKYDRKLTLKGFIDAMTKNKTNIILMLQGFFTNVPWGVIFTFLNDYLSQEQGLSVPTSTFLVFCFGIGSAVGGVYGGIAGGALMKINRTLLPLFMASATLGGIAPFLGLLDWNLQSVPMYGVFFGFTGGVIANLPAVNVRPCILNVNPPETRGAAMTANNLMVNVARGAGPSLITLSQSFFGVSRQYSFNVTLIIFWGISTSLLLILALTLPDDQDRMETELANYAESKKKSANQNQMQFNLSEKYKDIDKSIFDDSSRFNIFDENNSLAGEESIVSIEDRMSSFDAAAARESWTFIEDALREIAQLTKSRNDGYETIDEVWEAPYDNVNVEEEDAEKGKNSFGGAFDTTPL